MAIGSTATAGMCARAAAAIAVCRGVAAAAAAFVAACAATVAGVPGAHGMESPSSGGAGACPTWIEPWCVAVSPTTTGGWIAGTNANGGAPPGAGPAGGTKGCRCAGMR